MGKWYDTNITIDNPTQYQIGDGRLHDRIILLNKQHLHNIDFIKKYSKYLVDNSDQLQDHQILYSMGDYVHNIDLPVICKVTNLAHAHIIAKLNHIRHWNLVGCVKEHDIAYKLKRNSIVWRGNSTGYTTRKSVVDRYNAHPIFNIGFNELVHNVTSNLPTKDYLSIEKQLTYKFILSVEGNDVASGLKWQLYSNSVVIMAKPTCVSWAMEDLLVPYVHYIPVKADYSDLEEAFNWALTHEAECIAITKAANAFIEQFLDEKNEQEIHRRILTRYIKNVQIG